MKNPGGPLVSVLELVSGKDSPFNRQERAVAISIASHMNKDSRSWPSVARLSQRTGWSRGAVKKALKTLCEGQHAIFDRRLGGSTPSGKRYPSTYTLNRVTTRPGHHTTRSLQSLDRVTTGPRPGHHTTLDRVTPGPLIVNRRAKEENNERVEGEIDRSTFSVSERQELEREALEIAKELSEEEGIECRNAIARSADYPGAKSKKYFLTSMTDKRLYATLEDLRSRQRALELKTKDPYDQYSRAT